MADNKTAPEKAIDRAEFFRLAYKKAVKASYDVASSILSPMESLTLPFQGTWSTATLFSPLDSQPRLLFVRGMPVFAWLSEEEPRAFLARCPKDGEMLQWQPIQQLFVCHSCRAQFDTTGRQEGEGEGTPIKFLPCRLQERELSVILEP